MDCKFKTFEIREPNFILGLEPEDKNYFKYNFDVVKKVGNDQFFIVIGRLHYDPKEGDFNFESIGLRYLVYREDGLEEWLILWCEMKKVEYNYDED